MAARKVQSMAGSALPGDNLELGIAIKGTSPQIKSRLLAWGLAWLGGQLGHVAWGEGPEQRVYEYKY